MRGILAFVENHFVIRVGKPVTDRQDKFHAVFRDLDFFLHLSVDYHADIVVVATVVIFQFDRGTFPVEAKCGRTARKNKTWCMRVCKVDSPGV